MQIKLYHILKLLIFKTLWHRRIQINKLLKQFYIQLFKSKSMLTAFTDKRCLWIMMVVLFLTGCLYSHQKWLIPQKNWESFNSFIIIGCWWFLIRNHPGDLEWMKILAFFVFTNIENLQLLKNYIFYKIFTFVLFNIRINVGINICFVYI